MAAHHFADRGQIGRTARGACEHRRDLTEVLGSEQPGRHDGQEPRVRVVAVLEGVDRAARDEDDPAGMQLALLALDGERRDSGQALVDVPRDVVSG